MGTTQSKKRRKVIHKKKRGSISYSDSMLPPRSASMDVLHHHGMAANSSATCPLCPHCRFTVSWSSDHSLSNSLCLHHAKHGQHEFGRGLDKEGFDSCPECLQIQTTATKTLSSSSPQSQLYYNQHHLCEISNQDYDEISTMSLNRKISGRQSSNVDCNSNNNDNRIGGISQSKSADFGDFSRGTDFNRVGQQSQTKENVNPISCGGNNNGSNTSENQVTSVVRRFGDGDCNHHSSMTAKQQSTLREMSTRSMNVNMNSKISSTKNSSLSGIDDYSNKETKSNFLSLLEDEEVVRSRWIRQKQRAQELRTLRMHLQHEEDVRHQTCSDSTQISPINNKPRPIRNVNTGTEERSVLSESFTPATARPLTEGGSIFDNNKQTGLSDFTIPSKDAVSRNSDFNTTDTTPTTNTITSNSTTSSSLSPSHRSIRSKFSKLSNYRHLDNHPVMTRLQNEQNNRVEMMERRIEEIRISAMQEAERKRFAEIFPAKDNDTETQKLWREARESLERRKEEKRKKALFTKDQQYQPQLRCRNQFRASSAPPGSDWAKNADNSQSQEDAGEIIPVIHVLSSSRETTPVISCDNKSQKITVPEKNIRNNKKSLWGQGDWPDINLGKPLTWLWLPFMLFPLVLRMLLSLFLNSTATPTTPRNGNSVTNTRCSHTDRNRNLPRDKRKKSC